VPEEVFVDGRISEEEESNACPAPLGPFLPSSSPSHSPPPPFPLPLPRPPLSSPFVAPHARTSSVKLMLSSSVAPMAPRTGSASLWELQRGRATRSRAAAGPASSGPWEHGRRER